MSDPTKNVFGGALQRSSQRLRTRAALLLATLALTASVVASPTVKPVDARTVSEASAKKQSKHWFQIGKASWYGRTFNGRKTADGEMYDMNAFTCAHRTLPLGSWIRVTNLRNQRTAFLRVNDRGPLSSNLIVDLSYAAAQRLGVSGLAKVRLEAVSSNDPVLMAEWVNQIPLPTPQSPLVLGQ